MNVGIKVNFERWLETICLLKTTALVVMKEREKPGQLSNLPENSLRHTAHFRVPRNDRKIKLWDKGERNRRPSLSAYGLFIPSRGATLPAVM